VDHDGLLTATFDILIGWRIVVVPGLHANSFRSVVACKTRYAQQPTETLRGNTKTLLFNSTTHAFSNLLGQMVLLFCLKGENVIIQSRIIDTIA